MQQIKCLMEELDERTNGYLRTVRMAEGRRCPGLYFPGSNPWPGIALIVGPIIAIAFVIIGLNSIKDAWATALLQTAGVMLGGWMFVYALRRYMGKGSPRFAGFFSYFDPHHVFKADGEHVEILDVSQATSITAQKAVGGMAAVRFQSESGSVFWRGLNVNQAELVQDFYSARDWIRTRDEAGKNLDAAVLGGAAKEFALTEELPRSFEDINLEVEAIPDKAEKTRKAMPGLMKYLIIVGTGILVYAGFTTIDSPIRDHAAWANAQENGAPGYRAYLLDDRNTRHRDEANQKLAEAYEPPIQKIKLLAKDTPLRNGMIQLLEGLKTAGQPIVSIRVKNAPGSTTPIPDYVLSTTQENIGDGVALSVGEKLISFLVPEPDENPHVELVVNDSSMNPRSFEVIIRLKPDGEPIARGTLPYVVPIQGEVLFNGAQNPMLAATGIKDAVLMALIGEIPAAPIPVPTDGDGDW